MPARSSIGGAMLAACLLLPSLSAQVDGVTATAFRFVDFEPDEVTFAIAVTAEPDSSLDAVLAAVKELGLQARNLSAIMPQQFGPPPEQTRLTYQFNLTAPFGQLQAVQERIATARRRLVAEGSRVQVASSGFGISSSETARQETRRRLLPELLGEARRNAETLAAASGKGVGDVLSIAESPVGLAGAFTGGIGFVPSNLRTTFTVTARFALVPTRGGSIGGDGIQ
jgi:hypothetical protein